MCRSYDLLFLYLVLFVFSALLASLSFRLWDMSRRLLSGLAQLWQSAHSSESLPPKSQAVVKRKIQVHPELPFAIFFLFLFAGPVLGQGIDLSMKGAGVEIVKVDKVIVVKEDATIVKSFPFTVTSPKANVYFWKYPPSVTAMERGEILEVTAAPKGAVVISIQTITIDVDEKGLFKGIITRNGTVSFTVGDAGAPPVIPPTATKAKFLTFHGLTADTAAIAANAALLARLKSSGVETWTYAAGDPKVVTLGLDEAVKAVGVPCVVIQDKEGNVIASSRLTSLQAANDFLTPILGNP